MDTYIYECIYVCICVGRNVYMCIYTYTYYIHACNNMCMCVCPYINPQYTHTYVVMYVYVGPYTPQGVDLGGGGSPSIIRNDTVCKVAWQKNNCEVTLENWHHNSVLNVLYKCTIWYVYMLYWCIHFGMGIGRHTWVCMCMHLSSGIYPYMLADMYICM